MLRVCSIAVYSQISIETAVLKETSERKKNNSTENFLKIIVNLSRKKRDRRKWRWKIGKKEEKIWMEKIEWMNEWMNTYRMCSRAKEKREKKIQSVLI